MKIRFALLLISWIITDAFSWTGAAATYYVATTGNDANPGTMGSPWRTIGKAAATLVPGDDVSIGDGDYNEHVHLKTSGTSDKPITYRAARRHCASLRAFRLSGQYIMLDGLRIDRYSGVGNSWGAALRIEAASHNNRIQNCLFADAPYVIAHDVRFDHTRNEIISLSSDFIAAGFVPGSKIYLGASGKDGFWYTNHDTIWTVASNTATRLWVTNSTGGSFLQDPGSNYWAVIRPGTAATGFPAINFLVSGGVGPTNVLVHGNIISNWMGHAISLAGNGNTVSSNRITKLKSFRFLSFDGSNHLIQYNIVKDSPNILWYTPEDFDTIVHPQGTGWYDYAVGMLSGFAIDNLRPRTNVVIRFNWMENLENQLGRVDDEQEGTHGITYHNNVFIGVSAAFSGGRDSMRWISNTFYRCAFDGAHPLALGGRPPSQQGYVISSNLFIDCGRPESLSTRGWYGVSTNAVNPLMDWNMVAGPEINGFNAKEGFSEQNGINGGSPGFVNVMDFMGPDGTPFTDDDGLKVLPNSMAARVGGGALGVRQIITNQPLAHFKITSPIGWFENLGSNYDLQWLTNTPTRRGALQRPFDTPQRIGDAPIRATFDAEASISGIKGLIDNAGITNYIWNFSDGSIVNTSIPAVSHVFERRGDWIVSLTVVNVMGNSHCTANIFRVSQIESVSSANRPAAPQKFRVFH